MLRKSLKSLSLTAVKSWNSFWIGSWVQFCHSVADFVAWPLTASVSELQWQNAQPEVQGLFIHHCHLLDGSEWHWTTTQAEHFQHEEFMTQSGHNMERWRESCQNKITNHVHHPQTKMTSLAWTCQKNGQWMHPKRPFVWRNEKREAPNWMSLAEVYGCALTRHEEHQIPTDHWEETALDHASWKAEIGWALKQNQEKTSEKTTAKSSSSIYTI